MNPARVPTGSRGVPGPVYLLAFLIGVWAPVGLAAEASAALPRLMGYGWPAFLLLFFRGAVAGFGMVVGRSLWVRHPGGPAGARAWLTLDAVGTMLTFATPYFPANYLPGTKTPTVVTLLTLDAAAFCYLTWSRRVRATWDQPS